MWCVLRVYGAADANRARVRGRANDANTAVMYFLQHLMPARTDVRLQAAHAHARPPGTPLLRTGMLGTCVCVCVCLTGVCVCCAKE